MPISYTVDTLRKGLSFFMLAAVLAACGDQKPAVEEVPVVEEIEVAEEEAATVQEWDYENTNWEKISDTECRSNVQSPVDIDPQEAIVAALEDIQYNYTPFPMKIVDNGHTVQVFGTETSSIVVQDKEYQFMQFHFHYPAEHTINDKRYPMEMHLVHKEKGTDNLAVLAVFIEEAATENQFLEKVFTQIPAVKEQEMLTDVMLTLSDFIPPVQEHYTYLGSLTTPPCTVGVDWIIFPQPITASREQIAKFAALYANNARPLQPLQNRRVLKTAE